MKSVRNVALLLIVLLLSGSLPITAGAETAITAGSTIMFGHYEQDSIISNGKESIEWLVLEVENNRAFLISKYILDAQPYNDVQAEVSWETCTLRAWMNNTFLNEAFSPAEQAAIVTTMVDNSPQ